MTDRTCSIDGCERPARKRGWCGTHYARFFHSGNVRPDEPVRAWSTAPPGIDPVEWFWMGFARAESGCLEWQRRSDNNGYGICSDALGDGSGRVHRVAWILAHGKIPDGQLVRHIVCNNPPCGDFTHLALGTTVDNMADKVAAGRQARGDRNGRATLVGPQVLSILLRLAGGYETQRQIAARFGVSPSTITSITKRRTWKHYSL